MKKLRFPLYGFLIGTTFSVFASILFSIIVVMIIFGIYAGDPFQSLVMIGCAGLYSVMFAFLPGGIGGAYLAGWLNNSERTEGEITRHGLFVGAVAGLITSLAFVAIVFRFLVAG